MLPVGGRALRWSASVPLTLCVASISSPMLLLAKKDFHEFLELLNSNGVRFLIVGGHPTHPFIALRDLLRNKRATGRPQDLADVEKLSASIKRGSVKMRRRKWAPRNSGGQ